MTEERDIGRGGAAARNEAVGSAGDSDKWTGSFSGPTRKLIRQGRNDPCRQKQGVFLTTPTLCTPPPSFPTALSNPIHYQERLVNEEIPPLISHSNKTSPIWFSRKITPSQVFLVPLHGFSLIALFGNYQG